MCRLSTCVKPCKPFLMLALISYFPKLVKYISMYSSFLFVLPVTPPRRWWRQGGVCWRQCVRPWRRVLGWCCPQSTFLWRWSPIPLELNKVYVIFFQTYGSFCNDVIVKVRTLLWYCNEVVICMNKLILAYIWCASDFVLKIGCDI